MASTSSTRWHPQAVQASAKTRAVTSEGDLVWFPTEFPGVWFAPFEADDTVQRHPVTMLTRMEPGAFFPLHGHPGGEEVLVVEGVFEDHTGAYPAGSYLTNPEGFEHRPTTSGGCVTFVKLRQHGGRGRAQVRSSLGPDGFLPSGTPGITTKELYRQAGFTERVWGERWEAGAERGTRPSAGDVYEVYVFDGSWTVDGTTFTTGSWLRLLPDDQARCDAPEACTLYLKSYPLASARYVVDPGFRHPDGSPAT